MNKLEALAEAIAYYNGYYAADSVLYKTRNPGGLKAFSPRQEQNEQGLRVFKSFIDGWQAFLFDLKIKCSGKSRAKVTLDSTLKELMRVYGMPESAARYVAKFCRKACGTEEIDENTSIKYFVE